MITGLLWYFHWKYWNWPCFSTSCEVLIIWSINRKISQEKGMSGWNVCPSQPVPLTMTSDSSCWVLGDTTIEYSILVADGLFIISNHNLYSQELGSFWIKRSRLLLVSTWAMRPAKIGESFSMMHWFLAFLWTRKKSIEILPYEFN